MNTNNPGIYRVQNIPWQAKLQGAKLATFKSRLLAFLLDLLAVGAILLAASMWASPKNVSMGEELTISLEVSGLVAFATFVAYFAISTFIGRGATIGKRLAGIQVVSLVHDHLSLWHCIERTLGYSASSLEVGFGFLQFFTHPNRQTVHDRIAETIVVERSKRVRKLVKTIDAK
jgi:uncharacterized RDD family membrane protein YckC